MHPVDPRLPEELNSLLSSNPPPFIYINDPTSPRIVTAALLDVLAAVPLIYVHVDAVACFTSRLFFDRILHGLNLLEDKHNANFDAFLHGLKLVHAKLPKDARIAIVIEQVDRLKDRLPELIVPMTRLSEMSQIPVSVVFVSQVGWSDVRPLLGSPDPYFIDVPPPRKEVIIQWLTSSFSDLASDEANHPAYHPALRSLYAHFVSALCDVCYPFTHEPHELAYIAAARWPGFVQPVLDSNPDQIVPPSEEIRLRLSKYFIPTFTAALNQLYPRRTNAQDWAKANRPPENLLQIPHNELPPPTVSDVSEDDNALDALPRLSKFILVAAYIASMNPPKTDLRMFGRGLDEKKRKRRALSKPRAGSSKVTVPQHFVGPGPFPLDRMMAILGALLEENDTDQRREPPEYTIPGEFTDMETFRVGVYSAITQLATFRLLQRTSPADKLDGPPMFKCRVPHKVVLALARQLDITLNDLLWDPR